MYYEIDLNNDIEVTKIEYYLWNEMNFKWVSTWNWTSKIYLYFDSFYDKKIDNYGNIEYIWKYENFKTYAFSPEKLKIFQSSDIIEINFQFYLPKFDIENFYNGFIVRNLSNKIVINTTSSWDLNNNFKLNYDYVFDNDKLIISSFYWNIDFSFYWKYDIFLSKFHIFDWSCNDNIGYNYKIDENIFKFIEDNDLYKALKLDKVNFILKKYNNWNFLGYNNFSNKITEWSLSFSWLENWLYSFELSNLETIDKNICSLYYNKTIKDIYSWVKVFTFYSKDNKIYNYFLNFNDIFPSLKDLNFTLGYEYYNNLQNNIFQIEKFKVNLKDKENNILYSTWTNFCIQDTDCNNRLSDDLKDFISNSVKPILVEVEYKDNILNEDKKYNFWYKQIVFNSERSFSWYTMYDFYNNIPNNNLKIKLLKNNSEEEILQNNNYNYILNIIWLFKVIDVNNQTKLFYNYETDESKNIFIDNDNNKYICNYNGDSNYYDCYNKENINYNCIYDYNSEKIICENGQNNFEINYKTIFYDTEYKEYICNFNQDNQNYECIDENNQNYIFTEKYDTKYIFDKDNNEIKCIEDWYYYNCIDKQSKEYECSFNYDWVSCRDSQYNEYNFYENIKNKKILKNNNYTQNYYNSDDIYIKNDDLQNINKIIFYLDDVLLYEYNLDYDKDLKEKLSNNLLTKIKHLFLPKDENTIFKRKIEIYSDNQDSIYYNNYYNINTTITWENLWNIDYSKLYFCTEEIYDTKNINENLNCVSFNNLDKYTFSINTTNIFIYWLKWFVNETFKKIILNFKFDFYSVYIPS